MNDIREFNQILNRSEQNRFQRWSEYRSKLTYVLESYFDTENSTAKSSLLLIGTGNSDDIDLSRIEKFFSNILLTDIDPVAMQSAFKRYHLNPEVTKIQEIDYTGFENNLHWSDFINNILKLDFKDAETYIFDMFRQSEKYDFMKKHGSDFDTIVISPIYTQLLLPQFLHKISILNDVNYPKESIRMLQDIFLRRMSKLIDRFNQTIFKHLSPNGSVIIISDIFETKPGTDFYRQVSTALSSEQAMERFHHDYQRQYGLGLGDYGLENAKEYGHQVASQWMEWPFSNERIIYVKIAKLKKTIKANA